jgi:hypothetical protein
MKIIFFSEGLEHTRFLEPIINKLIEFNNYEIDYYSLDKSEELKISKKLNFIFIKKNNLLKVFKNVTADYFFTTTPGVGSFYFPKSKNVGNYVYTFHSLLSPNEIYIKNSFTNFDIIMAPNDLIASQLVPIVSGKTKLITTGYPLFTNFKKITIKEKTALIAPSWGKNNIFVHKNFKNLLKELAINDFITTIRPHPMQQELFDKDTIQRYQGNNIIFDFNKDLVNLGEYSTLITDWSGISLEYFKLNHRKIIFTDTPKKIRRKRTNKEKEFDLIEDLIRQKIGIIYKLDEKIDSVIEEIDNPNLNIDMKFLESIYKPSFYDFRINQIFEI